MKPKITEASQRYVTELRRRLLQRTAELAAVRRELRRGGLRRRKVEWALERSGARQRNLLKDSLRLQAGLRELTHRVIAAQEDERRKVSFQLRNGVAQTLLGVNVRLLSLKKEARSNSKGLKNELVSMQRLAVESARSVRRVARNFGRS